jgi:hypothetical protein
MANAKTKQHSTLGTLRFETGSGEWTTEVRWGGESVALSICAEDNAPDALFDDAARVLSTLDADAVKRFAADQMLDLYNDTWSEDEDDIDAAEFVSRLKPGALEIDDDGGSRVYLDDGELFQGHTIMVRLNARREPIQAKLAG